MREEALALQQNSEHDKLQKLINNSKESIEKEYNVELDLPLSEKQLDTYTTIGGAPHLDGDYTVYGEVISGLEVVDKIVNIETGQNARPVEDMIMTMEVEEIKKKKITKLYGYQYPEIKK